MTADSTARLLDLPQNQLRRAGKYGYWHVVAPAAAPATAAATRSTPRSKLYWPTIWNRRSNMFDPPRNVDLLDELDELDDDPAADVLRAASALVAAYRSTDAGPTEFSALNATLMAAVARWEEEADA